MKPTHTTRLRFTTGHILAAIVAAATTAGALSACSTDVDTPAPAEATVTLALNISTTDVTRGSRAGEPDGTEGPATDYEKLNQLRIIIVDGNGKVEHNRFYNYNNYYYTNVTHELEVTPNDTKAIYLIANEHAERGDIELGGSGAVNQTNIVDYNFNQVVVGEELPADFTDYKLSLPVGDEMINNIPMTAVYKMQIGSESKQSLSFMLNRCAVKYSFNFTNKSSAQVKISELRIDKTATTEWFFPRVKSTDGSTIVHQLEYTSTADDATPIETATGEVAEWQTDISGKNAFYTAHLYNNYAVPTDAAHQQYTRSVGVTVKTNSEVNASFTNPQWKPFYLLESAYIPEGKTEQTYTVTFGVNGVELTKELPNLPRLPRNTHVVVNVTFNDHNNISCEVEMEPYRGVTLNPGFGIDPDKPDDPDKEHIKEEDYPDNNPDAD